MPDRGDPQDGRDPGSFRDPSGFVYRAGGALYRQIDRSFAAKWNDLVSTGLLATLQDRGILIRHDVVDVDLALQRASAHAVIRPESLAFVSYPYEWTFGELKDAALLTLEAQSVCMAAGFTLRDATAYNVQFVRGRPILIDTLSFERAEPGAPWIAYRQFCEHFLAPLALMARRDIRCGLLLRDFIDGIPIDLAATLLPGRTRVDLGLGSHIHAHARAQRRHARIKTAGPPLVPRRMSELQQAALLDSLRRTVEKLDWRPIDSAWAEYVNQTSYSDEAERSKDEIVERYLRAAGARMVWDLGANTGRFSAIAAQLGARVVSWDADPGASELHYRALRQGGSISVLPLVADLTNPSPGLGWAGAERLSLLDRADADTILALALVHHLAISRNVPWASIADLFARLGRQLIVEFVPKTDPMVRRLLAHREDVFPDYSLEGFRAAFTERFDIVEEIPIDGSDRSVVRMTGR